MRYILLVLLMVITLAYVPLTDRISFRCTAHLRSDVTPDVYVLIVKYSPLLFWIWGSSDGIGHIANGRIFAGTYTDIEISDGYYIFYEGDGERIAELSRTNGNLWFWNKMWVCEKRESL